MRWTIYEETLSGEKERLGSVRDKGASKKKERRMEKAKRKQQELTLRRIGREKKENKNM